MSGKELLLLQTIFYFKNSDYCSNVTTKKERFYDYSVKLPFQKKNWILLRLKSIEEVLLRAKILYNYLVSWYGSQDVNCYGSPSLGEYFVLRHLIYTRAKHEIFLTECRQFLTSQLYHWIYFKVTRMLISAWDI